MSPFLLGI